MGKKMLLWVILKESIGQSASDQKPPTTRGDGELTVSVSGIYDLRVSVSFSGETSPRSCSNGDVVLHPQGFFQLLLTAVLWKSGLLTGKNGQGRNSREKNSLLGESVEEMVEGNAVPLYMCEQDVSFGCMCEIWKTMAHKE